MLLRKIRGLGYEGSYTTVVDYVRPWAGPPASGDGALRDREPVSLAVAADAKGCRGGGDLLNDRTCAVRAWQRAKLA